VGAVIVVMIGEVVAAASEAGTVHVHLTIASSRRVTNMVGIAMSLGDVDEAVAVRVIAAEIVDVVAIAFDPHLPLNYLAQTPARAVAVTHEAAAPLGEGATPAKGRDQGHTAVAAEAEAVDTEGRVAHALSPPTEGPQHRREEDTPLPPPEVDPQAAPDADDATQAPQDHREVTLNLEATAETVAPHGQGLAAGAGLAGAASLQDARIAEIGEIPSERGRMVVDAGGIALHPQHHPHPLLVANPLTLRKMNVPQQRRTLSPRGLRAIVRWVQNEWRTCAWQGRAGHY